MTCLAKVFRSEPPGLLTSSSSASMPATSFFLSASGIRPYLIAEQKHPQRRCYSERIFATLMSSETSLCFGTTQSINNATHLTKKQKKQNKNNATHHPCATKDWKGFDMKTADLFPPLDTIKLLDLSGSPSSAGQERRS